MKKIKRGTPEKLVCDFCGAEKKEITFVIGACSKPGTDWCMVYGTGKMACPACYVKATEEAANKGRKITEAQEAPKAPQKAAGALSRALAAADMALTPAPALKTKVEAAQEAFFNNEPGSGAALDNAIAEEERAEKMRNLPARACSIICTAYPEWGTFGVMTDCGSFYEVRNHAGARVLDKAEAAKFWEIVEPAEKAPAAPVEPAACQDCSRKRGQSGPCSDYGGFGCGLYFEQHPETHFKPEPPAIRAKIIEVAAETVQTPAAPVIQEVETVPADASGAVGPLAAGGVTSEPCEAFESGDAQAVLRPILDQVKNSVYLPDYRAGVKDAEALGVLVSKFFKWDGADILAVAYSALEDANYHSDNKIIERMQKGEDVAKTIKGLEEQNNAKARIIAAQSELIEKMAKELSAMHSEYCKDCAGGCPTLELIDKAKAASDKSATAPAAPSDNLLTALIWQRDYCDKQAAANSEDAALWRQAAGRARIEIERIDK